MTHVSKLKIVSLLIFIIPILSINICLILSQIFEFREFPTPGNYFGDFKIYDAGDALRDKQGKEWAIPYIDGSASISRIGRVFPNYIIFKPALIITGILIIYYWVLIKKIFVKNHINQVILNKIYKYGFLAAACLIIHSIFLGIKIDNDFYKLFIRLNLFFTLVFAITSKIYFVSNLNKINKNYLKNLNKSVIKTKLFIISFITILAIAIIPMLPFINIKNLKYIIEWNYYILIFSFYLSTFFLFKKN
jgi:hypothetical protein